MEPIKLSKPIVDGEKKIAEVSLDFDALTGADIDTCIREATAAKAGEFVASIELDTEFHAQIAAKLIGIPREGLKTMGARDYARLIKPVRNFFLDSE